MHDWAYGLQDNCKGRNFCELHDFSLAPTKTQTELAAMDLSTSDICESIRNCTETWPPFKHIDIRELNKEKNTMSNKTKTVNFCVNKVIFNGPATIVIWGDGTKTVVKCKDGDSYSKWAGFALCFAKHLYGDDFHRQFRHWCGVEDSIPKKISGNSASVSEAVSFACDTFETFGKNASEYINGITKALSGSGKTADYRDVVFKDTFEAGLVLKNMRNIIDALGFVSVADCCHLVGALIHFGDHDIGWTDISKAMVIPVANGFLIKYPEPASRTQSSKRMKNPETNEFKLIDIPCNDYKTALYVKEYICGLIENDGYATVGDYYDVSETVFAIAIADRKRDLERDYGWTHGTRITVAREGEKYFIRFSDNPKKLNHEHPMEKK